MNALQYQREAMRTKCDQAAAGMRLSGATMAQINHAVIGLAGEVGELATLLQKVVYYGKDLEWDKFVAELGKEGGDACWYLAELFEAAGLDFEAVMKANIAKLRARYPEKWNAEQADHNNRNLTAEDKAADDVFAALARHQGGTAPPQNKE